MTPFPYSIAASASLAEAEVMLRQHGIRHLAVCEGHALVGILAEHDLRVRHRELAVVSDVCMRNPYVVDLDTPLDVVASQMAERLATAVLIVKTEKLVGILTVTDVCRLLAAMLREGSEPGDDEAA
ncbi:CBS domain-containing protein [Nannocystaceae bacterium ST9]